MKNLLMIALAFMTLNATAQERKKGDRKAEVKERMEVRQNMTPEETAQLQTKKMTLHLDLTEKQQAEVEKVLLAEAKERKAKMEAFKAKKEAGEEFSKDDRVKMQNERLDNQIEMKKKMKEILNADQYAKFEQTLEKRHSRKGGKDGMRKKKE
ncbi:hypothetical protein M0G43_00195 [Subsaxibacter sp. CAU 1640]|uniref:hypothetical protein n=1 Tax=Subsaxibacter sp. CAU 1640 TaxID=2933271 RepID=UPI0020052C8E|nr:hypothetical protein [Subsaxibacter sp. CAU 1640]MCK7588983.1 hypothetical protein [Subsaxibacter sp. CAU 1640]